MATASELTSGRRQAVVMAMPEKLEIANVSLEHNLEVHKCSDTSTVKVVSINDYSHEELLQKHRKERKEFQGQVQSIRKLAAKADKKKKKEAAEQIAKLELELEKRQNEELHQLEVDNISQQIENITKSDVTTTNKQQHVKAVTEGNQLQQRVTKAQKRRDKKYNKSKEREQQIEAQEVENIHGARHVETQKIKLILKERNLMIHEIPSDGNCLYCAIDHQWQNLHGEEFGLENLRMKTSEFLRANRSDFLPFIIHPDTEDMLTEEQYEEYCSKVGNTPAWGGEVELRALSHILNCSIEVIQSNGPSIIVGKEYKGGKSKSVILTYHRHMYSLGEHYNSVKPYEELEEDEAQPSKD